MDRHFGNVVYKRGLLNDFDRYVGFFRSKVMWEDNF